MKFKCLIISVLIVILLINQNFGDDYCSQEIKSILAFNLGRFVFIIDEESVNNIWQFDSENNILVDQKLDINSIFVGNTLISVKAAVGFNFNRCKVGNSSGNYCEKILRAKNLVLAVGLKFQTETSPPDFVYFSYRMESDNTPELTLISEETEMVWDLNTHGSLTDSFWIKDGSDLIYQSLVFAPQRTELYASVKSSEGINTLYLKNMDKNGEWSEWTRVKDIGFIGMFCIKGRVFGMDSNNIVHEFIWTDNKLEFEKNAKPREFFNCYQNSTLSQYKSITDNGNTDEPSNTAQTYSEIAVEDDNQTAITDRSTNKSDPKSNKTLLIIIIVIFVLIVVIILAIVLWICFRKRNSITRETIEEENQSNRSLDESKITGLNTKSSKMSQKPSTMSSGSSSKVWKKGTASTETIRSKLSVK